MEQNLSAKKKAPSGEETEEKTDGRGKKENEAEEISLRPHHGLCLLNFRGKGYSDDFSRNMTAMQELLLRHPETRIRIAEGADDLCARCPNRRGHACSSEHPPLFDANVLRMTGHEAGEVMIWQEFSSATEPLSLYHLDEACPDCEWLSLCHEIARERIRGKEKG